MVGNFLIKVTESEAGKSEIEIDFLNLNSITFSETLTLLLFDKLSLPSVQQMK